MARIKWANQFKKSRNHYPPSGDLLDNGQKARIAILAKEAFQKTPNAERSTSNLEFEQWRHEQQFLAIGKESLRDATQADYLKLRGHFENLAGEPGRAVKTHMADAVKDKAIAMLKLRGSLAERGLHVSYAETICKGKCRGRGLDDANAKEIWEVNFTVRNRRKKKTADHADSADLIPLASENSESSAVDYPF